MNCWIEQLFWSIIFCKTYKFICNMWCVMCDAWCKMFHSWFFVWSSLYESRGDQKYPILVISDLLIYIPKLMPGGSRMYTITCKSSYHLLKETYVQLKHFFLAKYNYSLMTTICSNRLLLFANYIHLIKNMQYFINNLFSSDLVCISNGSHSMEYQLT